MIRIDDIGPPYVERRGGLSVLEIRMRIARDVEIVAGSVARVTAIMDELTAIRDREH